MMNITRCKKPEDEHQEVQKPEDEHHEVQEPEDEHQEVQKPEDEHHEVQKPEDEHHDVQIPEVQISEVKDHEIEKPGDVLLEHEEQADSQNEPSKSTVETVAEPITDEVIASQVEITVEISPDVEACNDQVNC